MPASYNSKKIIPAPFLAINKAYTTNADGIKIGKTFNLTVRGELVSYKGSPNSSKVFWTSSGYPDDEVLTDTQKLSAIIRKQEALRDLFATDGASFEVQGYDGAAPLKCNPRVKSINIPDGQWYDRCPYTIELEADVVYVNGTALDEDGDLNDYFISNFDEDWSLEPADEDALTYRFSHRLNAVGKSFYNSAGTLVQSAWENARDYIINRVGLGLDQSKLSATGVLNFGSDMQAYNYTRTQNINEANGTFGVNENWTIFSPIGNYAAIEEFTVTIRGGLDGYTSASIEGNIRGLEKRNNSTHALISTKYAQASGRFSEVESLLYNRVSVKATGVTLNPVTLNSSRSENEKTGVITYSKEFNNRASVTLSGVLSEVFTVGLDKPGSIVAQQPVIGRTAGPVLQDVQASTARRKTLSIEAIYPPSIQGFNAPDPDTDWAVDAFIPTATFVKKDSDKETFTASNGRYNRQVSWIYEV